MEVRDNSAVIRIPVADPASRKEGVLQFSLPRECLVGTGECEPTFFQADSLDLHVAVAAPQGSAADPRLATTVRNATLASGPVTVSVAAPGGKSEIESIEAILVDVSAALTFLGSAKDNVNYTNFNVRRTENDFNRMDPPLTQAQRDTVERDSSGSGNQMDFILWGARNSLKDTEQGNMRAGAASDGTVKSLGDAHQKLTDLELRMASDPTRFSDILPILDQARAHLKSASGGAVQLNAILSDCNQAFVDCDHELLLADQYVDNIRGDRGGRDVSPAATSLRHSVNRVGENLHKADGRVNSAEEQVDAVHVDATNARELLSGARDYLAHRAQAE